MSHPLIKWIQGAPKQLKVGMVLRSGDKVELVGSLDKDLHGLTRDFCMISGAPIEARGQLVEDYVLEWLGNDGIVKGKAK